MALGIAAISFASVLWAYAPHETMERTLKTLPLLLGLVLLVTASARLPVDGLKRGLRLLPFCVMLGFLVMDGEQMFNMPLYRLLNHLPPDTFLHPAVMNRAMICLTLFIFPALTVIMLAYANTKWRAVLCAGLAICALPALILTESQSTQVALLGGFACFLIVPFRYGWVWKALAVCVALYFIVFPWGAIYGYQFLDTVNASHYFGNKGAYGAQRMEVWHGVAVRVMERPFLGFGTEATRAMQLDIKKYFPTGTVLHPHNVALQVWIEFGVAGVAMACAGLAFLLRVICVDMGGMARKAALPTFMMSLLIGSTAYGMWQGWWIGLLMLLVAWFTIMRRFEPAGHTA
jgi:O-antigen ligase